MTGIHLSARRARLVITIYVFAATLFFLAELAFRDRAIFVEILTPARLAPALSLAKLMPQGLGSFYADRAAKFHEKGTAARRAWLFMSIWLGFWCAGQAILGLYTVVLRQTPPLPSAGDALFLVGYGFAISALFSFVSAYRSSGFAIGGEHEPTWIALGACLVFGIIGYATLMPIAVAATPISERLVNVGYPLLDLVALIPTLILLRINLRFRGGQVWRVWGVLLAGILFAMGGDVLFADTSAANAQKIGPLADLAFTLGYALCAYGARLQFELVARD